MRETITIPFGGGLDRASGLLVVDQAAFADLRNVNLGPGYMELRKGLARIGGALTGTHVIVIHPLRARAKGLVLVYDFGSGDIRLYITNPDGTGAVSKGVVAHVDAGSLPPRFLVADIYKRAFIAHDEPDIAKRAPTIVYNVQDDTTTDFITGLGGVPAFRGVQRHLNYMIAWGWGTDTDPDRPETLRISKPGEPLAFNPAHYFLVGQQGEAVLKADPVGTVLAVKKLTDTFQLLGSDRASFGVFPLDPNYGQMSSRLSISIGGINYFWSESGPRRFNGPSPSEDLELPLNLGGPSPDALAAAGDTETGFAYYDHEKREVWFIFGQWGYALHTQDQALRWSYRRFGIPLFAGGTFYESVVGSTVTPPPATVALVAYVSADSDSMTWSWTVSGSTTSADQIEWWVREKVGPFANVWKRKFVELIGLRSAGTTTVESLFAGEPSDWAIRITRSGVPGVVYASSNPTDWPAAAQHIGDVLAVTELPDPVPLRSIFYGGADEHALRIIYDPFDGWGAHVTHEVEVSDGGGGWTAVVETYDTTPEVKVNPVDAFDGLTRDVRIRRKSSAPGSLTTGWITIVGVVFVDELDDLFTALGSGEVYLADRDLVATPGVDFSAWTGTDISRRPSPTLGGPTAPQAPHVNDTPFRVTFDGINDVIGDFLLSVFDGAALLMVIRCTEAGAARRTVFEQAGGAKPTLSFNATGKLEFNYAGITLSAADRRGDWIIVGYTQANGAAAGRAYDGGTPLGTDGSADSTINHPATMKLFHTAANTQFFKGDVFAIVSGLFHLDDTQMNNAYLALKALALAAGITVVN